MTGVRFRATITVAALCFLFLIAAVLAFRVKSLSARGLPQQTVTANVVANPGFEEEQNGLPRGWNVDQSLRSKGSARLVSAAANGRFALELTPNRSNTDPGHLYGFGQLIPAGDLVGKRVRLQAAMKVAPGATATVLAFAIGPGFKPLNSIVLELTNPSPGFQVLTQSFVVDNNAAQVLVGCAVKGTSGKAWFDDVSFGVEGAATESAPNAPPPSVSAGGDASITIDAGQVVRTIPRTLYGTNIEWTNDANGIWDPSQNRVKPEFLAAAKDLGISLVRFPGGIFSDYYHWRDGVGPAAQRPTRPHVADDGKSRNSFGTDELVQFSRAIGAEPLLEVNIITGTPQEAADWVAYCNRPDNAERIRNGSRQPYNVRYWEIGNEPYGKSDDPKVAASSLTPQEYAKRYVAFATAMKAVDPNIVLIAAGGYNSGKYMAVSDNNWDRVLLQAAGPKIDFLAVHNAYAPLFASVSRPSFDEVYKAMLAFPKLVSENLDELSNQVRSYGGSNASHIQLAITEWGPFFHAIPSDPLVGHTKTLGSALYVASAMESFLRSGKTGIANFFKLTDGAFMGWIDSHGNPKASYYALQMFTHHFGTRLVRVDASGPRFSSRSVGNVAEVNDAPVLDAVASLDGSGKHLYVIVVNRQEAAVRARISLQGFRPGASARGWVLTAPSLDANNGNDLPSIPGLHWAKQMQAPHGSMFAQGKPGTVVPHEIGVRTSGPMFTYTFPPISVTALELSE